MFQLKVATLEEASSKIFNLQARKQQVVTRSPLQLINNFTQLLEEPGDDCISSPDPPASKVQPAHAHSPIPISDVFNRLKRDLPPACSPSIQEVDTALSNLFEDLV